MRTGITPRVSPDYVRPELQENLADAILDAECNVESAAGGLDRTVTYLAELQQYEIGVQDANTIAHERAVEIDRKRCLDTLIEAVKMLDGFRNLRDI